MGACASKPWKIDLRDICQGLRCFFACCKGQIIIRTSKTGGSEPEPPNPRSQERFMTPVLSGLILCFYVVQSDVERLRGLLKHDEE